MYKEKGHNFGTRETGPEGTKTAKLSNNHKNLKEPKRPQRAYLEKGIFHKKGFYICDSGKSATEYIGTVVPPRARVLRA